MKTKHDQSGATLVVAMIMLVVLTLLVVSGIRSSTSNLRITGNMQVQGEATAAAQQAIEQVLDTDYTNNPVAETITVPMGAVDYNVNVTQPVCANTAPVSTDELSPNDPKDLACFGSADPTSVTQVSGGTEKQVLEASLCNKQLWEIQADVSDSNSGAKTTLVQGVAVRAGRMSGC
ncbi:pilus assembly PilX N-terminal domain-containing protein [Noviherbaspirillum sp.]|uniref:pilus assembly PilX N-terminal domain-containing protein n=1 Tax=Noviherbaspirillum sp. TaxID=1926288 RepID=UPI0025DBB122|nr:pilus assembly PilX N-terminal domain-containing protein [Noviherbaspirillum sp.]